MTKIKNGTTRSNPRTVERFDVRNFLSNHASDPLFPFIEKLEGYHSIKVIEDDISMYQNTYGWYYLSLERFIQAMSIALRWSNGPYWTLKSRQRLNKEEKNLNSKHRKIARYIHIDFYNCLLYARILMDRVVGLSRLFLKQGNRPSFTSFNDHKKFYKKLTVPFQGHDDEYVSRIRDKTDWFDSPLKEVRDQFIVHASPRHLRMFGYPAGENELSLILHVPDRGTRYIFVSIPRIAKELNEFLSWFNGYALSKTRFDTMANKSLQRTPTSGAADL